ncbi:hypothetical protein ACFX1R_020842 [Malus domestica]
MLSLYEASYFAFEGENLLDEGLAFSTNYLKNLSGPNVTNGLAEQVLLEIAKRDFNRVQCTLQRDLQDVGNVP